MAKKKAGKGLPGSEDGRSDYEVEKVTADEQMIVKIFGGQDDAGPGTGSKQLPKDHFEKDVREGKVIGPPYDPLVWAFLLEQNTRLKKLVGTMAENTVGLGFEIVPLKEDESWQEENREKIKEEREMILEMLSAPNPELPFTELMKHTKIDEEATGQGWLEVTMTEDGSKPANLFHIPSYTMRVAKKGDKYVQMRPSDPAKRVYFKPWGEPRELDARTGEWAKVGEEIPREDQATQVLLFKLYTPRSSFYGVPRAVSAAPAIAGTRLAHRRNVAFFENDATPRIAITVNGGELSSESMEMIEQFIDTRGKGPGNAGRVMVLQARAADNILQTGGNLSINLTPLTVGVQDDASFIRYITANNEEVRECFGIGQIFIGTSDDVNRAVALAMKQLTVEQVFEPEAQRYEYRLNQSVIKALGATVVRLKFVRPKTTDIGAESQALSMLAAAGGVTPNDLRDFQDKPRFEGAWADTPLAVLRSGLLEHGTDEKATLFSFYGDTLPQPNLTDAQAEAARAQASAAGQQAAAKLADSLGPEGMAGLEAEMATMKSGLEKLGFTVTITPPA